MRDIITYAASIIAFAFLGQFNLDFPVLSLPFLLGAGSLTATTLLVLVLNRWKAKREAAGLPVFTPLRFIVWMIAFGLCTAPFQLVMYFSGHHAIGILETDAVTFARGALMMGTAILFAYAVINERLKKLAANKLTAKKES